MSVQRLLIAILLLFFLLAESAKGQRAYPGYGVGTRSFNAGQPGRAHGCGRTGSLNGQAFYYQTSPNLYGFGGMSALNLHGSGIFGTGYGGNLLTSSYYDMAAAARSQVLAMYHPRRERKLPLYPEPKISKCDTQKMREEKLHDYLSYMTTSGRFSHRPAVAATDSVSRFTSSMQFGRPFVADKAVTWNDVVYYVAKATATTPVFDEYSTLRVDSEQPIRRLPFDSESMANDQPMAKPINRTADIDQVFTLFRQHEFDTAAATLKTAIGDNSDRDTLLSNPVSVSPNQVSPAWDWLMEELGSYDRIHLIALWQELSGNPARATELLAAASHGDELPTADSRFILAMLRRDVSPAGSH